MRYFDKTFFKFLFGLGLIIVLGLVFISKVQAQSSLVNINTASLEELQTLNGIGPTYAQRIIDYRTSNGPFLQIEDIKNVSGIGDSTFNKIKDFITVGSASPTNSQNTTVAQNTSTNITDITNSSSSGEVETLKVSIVGEKSGVIGQPLEFRVETNSDKAHLAWNFGDGNLAYGKVVSHSYDYPGEYVVILSGSISGKKSVARLNIKISSDTLSITQASVDRIEIGNLGKEEINLHGREIVSGQDKFIFPEGTIILPNQKISFSSKLTKLYPTDKSGVRLSVVNNSTSQNFSPDQNQKEIEEITNKIISLQRKQMEIRNAGSQTVSSQLATVVFSNETPIVEATSTNKTLERTGLLGKIKKFFGFK